MQLGLYPIHTLKETTMAITRSTNHLEIFFADDGAIRTVSVGCREVFDADPDNPDIPAPERGNRYGWQYADLSTADQAVVGALVNAMISLLDQDHPINAG